MGKKNSEANQGEGKRNFSQEQYDMLKRCSDKKDMTEWNKWRKNNPTEDVLLEGAELTSLYLVDAHLLDACLRSAYLSYANLSEAILNEANLQDSKLLDVHLEKAKLRRANLEGADLPGAHLENANMRVVNLQKADISGANMEGADLWHANLQGVDGGHTDLRGAKLRHARLQGARFTEAIVDGATAIWNCEIDRNTDFTGVALESVIIDPGTKQLLEYNVRRKNWEGWYKTHSFWRWPVRVFWGISDYGISTGWVIWVFFWLAALFAVIYRLWPSCVIVRGNVGGLKSLLHAFYFSVVTMTTLGFGDIHANPDSWAGQILLMVQVLLGYVLLGALVTRFAVLFTAGGPAGKFEETDEKTKKKFKEIRSKKRSKE